MYGVFNWQNYIFVPVISANGHNRFRNWPSQLQLAHKQPGKKTRRPVFFRIVPIAPSAKQITIDHQPDVLIDHNPHLLYTVARPVSVSIYIAINGTRMTNLKLYVSGSYSPRYFPYSRSLRSCFIRGAYKQVYCGDISKKAFCASISMLVYRRRIRFAFQMLTIFSFLFLFAGTMGCFFQHVFSISSSGKKLQSRVTRCEHDVQIMEDFWKCIVSTSN